MRCQLRFLEQNGQTLLEENADCRDGQGSGTTGQGSDATGEIATRRNQEMEGIEYTATRSLSNQTNPKPGGFRATQQSLITP
mmetsp:Transcript_58380/g.121955  ORF Transcript_58380/g.121955 Transcript_58380/m.121955 type:complete len:82 (-) Transcript_58380:90-335(-)